MKEFNYIMMENEELRTKYEIKCRENTESESKLSNFKDRIEAITEKDKAIINEFNDMKSQQHISQITSLKFDFRIIQCEILKSNDSIEQKLKDELMELKNSEMKLGLTVKSMNIEMRKKEKLILENEGNFLLLIQENANKSKEISLLNYSNQQFLNDSQEILTKNQKLLEQINGMEHNLRIKEQKINEINELHKNTMNTKDNLISKINEDFRNSKNEIELFSNERKQLNQKIEIAERLIKEKQIEIRELKGQIIHFSKNELNFISESNKNIENLKLKILDSENKVKKQKEKVAKLNETIKLQNDLLIKIKNESLIMKFQKNSINSYLVLIQDDLINFQSRMDNSDQEISQTIENFKRMIREGNLNLNN